MRPADTCTAGVGEVALWLTCMLDQLDFGMLLADAAGHVHYLNRAAAVELDDAHPLCLGPPLGVRHPADLQPLHDALADAGRGQRRLVTLGNGPQRVSVSLVPLVPLAPLAPLVPSVSSPASPGGGSGPLTLLVLGKRQLCERLSVQGFARSVQLTPTETRVLEQLCAGLRPAEVATRQGVAVSTIRTQIGSIRAKTGAASIRELVRQVAVLPPLAGALRPLPGADSAVQSAAQAAGGP